MSAITNKSSNTLPFEKNSFYCPRLVKVSGIALGIILGVGALLAYFYGVNTAIVLTLGLGGAVIFTISLALILKDCKSQKNRSQSLMTIDLKRESNSEEEANIETLLPGQQTKYKDVPIENFDEFCTKQEILTLPKPKEDHLESEGEGFETNDIYINSDPSNEEQNSNPEPNPDKQGLVLYDTNQTEINASISFKINTNPEGILSFIKIEVDNILKLITEMPLKFDLTTELFFNLLNVDKTPLKNLIQKYSDNSNVLRYIFRELQNTPDLFENFILKVDEADKKIHPAYILLYHLDLNEEDFKAHLEYFFSMGFIPNDNMLPILGYFVERMLDIVPIKKNAPPYYVYHKLISHLFLSGLTPTDETEMSEENVTTEIFNLFIDALRTIAEKKSTEETIRCFSECVIRPASLIFIETDESLSTEAVQEFFLLFAQIISDLKGTQKVWQKQLDKVFLEELKEIEKGLQDSKQCGWFFQPIFIILKELWLKTDSPDESFKTLIKSISPRLLPFILINYLPESKFQEAFEVLGLKEFLNEEELPKETVELFKNISLLMDPKTAQSYFQWEDSDSE